MERKKAIEHYINNMENFGSTDSGLLVPKKNTIKGIAASGRDIAEEALAHKVLQNTNIPIPGKGSSRSQIENFLQDISKEHYPELGDTNLQLSKDTPGTEGTYDPNTKSIELNRESVRKDPRKAVANLLHEKAHQYDDIILNNTSGREIDDAAFQKARTQLKGKTDPTDIYETVARSAKHHAEIPKLREGSFGLGALKSMITSGKFKSLAPIGVSTALALAAGDASAAIPGLDSADNVGESPEDEKIMLAERNAKENYKNSEAKRNALNKIRGFSGK